MDGGNKMTKTAIDLVLEWKRGELTESELREALKLVDWAIYHGDEDGGWFEGKRENSVLAIQSLVGEDITMEDYSTVVNLIH